MRRMIAFLSASLLALTALLVVADEAPVVVHLVDGRTLEGVVVSEDAKGIVLRMKVGAEVPISRAEIKEIVPAEPAGEGAGSGEGDTEAPVVETQSVITLRDGAVIRGRLNDGGKFWEVENDLGTIRIEKRLVQSVQTEKVVRSAQSQAPVERDEARDLGLGFVVARPGPEWQFADQPPDPLARVVMRRQDPLVIFRVALAEPPPPERREVDPAVRNEAQAAIAGELKALYRAVRGLDVAVDRYKGVPVWRVTYQADARVFGSKFTVHEVRLTRGEAIFVLQAYAPLDQEKAALPEMARALESFSWVGPVNDTGGEYLDYGLGLRIARPRADWRLHVRLFDRAVPLEILPPDGRGRYRLEVAPAGGFATPQAAADALEKTLGTRSRFYRRIARVERNLSGVPAVDLQYQDFEAGSTLAQVRRLIFVREERLMQFVAAYPATEEGASTAERASATDALFDGIDGLVAESPLSVYRQGARAVALRVEGERKLETKDAKEAVDLLGQAIDLAPAYGRAYLLRGKAYADTGDYKRAMKDYDAADDLLDDPAIGSLIAAAQAEQGRRIAREDFAEAKKLFVAAIRNDPTVPRYKEDLARAILDYGRLAMAQGKYEAAIAEMADAERRFPGDTRYRRENVRAHTEWARKLQAEGELYKARGVLKRAARLDPENTSIRSQLERIEADIKKKEEGEPNKGGKRR